MQAAEGLLEDCCTLQLSWLLVCRPKAIVDMYLTEPDGEQLCGSEMRWSPGECARRHHGTARLTGDEGIASGSRLAMLNGMHGVGNSVSIVRSFSKLTVIKPVSMHLAVYNLPLSFNCHYALSLLCLRALICVGPHLLGRLATVICLLLPMPKLLIVGTEPNSQIGWLQ